MAEANVGHFLQELKTELDRCAAPETAYEPGELYLQILLDEATRLPSSKGTTHPCPYMIITGGRVPVQSNVQENSKSPLWNEHLKVEILSIPCVLKCEMRDSVRRVGSSETDESADKVLGSFEVVITQDFFKGGGYRHGWHHLQGQGKDESAQRGKVRLAYSFSEEILTQLRSGLHPGKQRTTQLVNETWVIVAKDYKTHARTFFELFFEYMPENNNPFARAGHADLDSPFMQTHSIQVLKTVGQILMQPNLEEELAKLLVSLGTLHTGMGIEDVHFVAMQAALLAVLESALGPRWDAEVKAAWQDSFSTVHYIMLPTFTGGDSGSALASPVAVSAETAVWTKEAVAADAQWPAPTLVCD